MLSLGIDPGTETTGYGLVDEDNHGNLSVVDFGVIKTSKEQKPENRLQFIYNEVKQIINLHQPQMGAVEKLLMLAPKRLVSVNRMSSASTGA